MFNIQIKQKNLVSILQMRAIYLAHKSACLFLEDGKDEISITYSELDKRARAIAADLQSKNLLGQCVLLLFPTGLDFISAFMGCLYAGVIAVPVNAPTESEPGKSFEVINAIARDTQAAGILTTHTYLSEIEKRNLSFIATNKFFLKDINSFDTGSTSIYQLPKISEDTIAYLQYSSGSTARLKAAIIRHGNLIHSLRYTAKVWDYNKVSVSLTWAPHSHVYGLIVGLLVPLYHGTLAILMPTQAFIQRPLSWLEAITKYKVTHSGCPNFGYDLCVQNIHKDELGHLNLRSWKAAINGGENVSYKTLIDFSQKFLSCGFSLNCFRSSYGMSELSGAIATSRCGKQPVVFHLAVGDLANNQVSIVNENVSHCTLLGNGQLLAGLEAKIVDPDTLMPVAKGKIGEIWLAGKSLASGYWDNPEETKAAFCATFPRAKKFYFRTGDLGFIKGKEICLTGRLKELIIVHGKNYYPTDLEMTITEALKDLPVSPHCVAFSVPVEGKEEVIVVQEIRDETSLHSEIITKIRHAIAERYGIHLYDVVLVKDHSIPRTPSGKLQRKLCQKQFLEKKLEVVKLFFEDKEASVNSSHDFQPDNALPSPIALLVGCERTDNMVKDDKNKISLTKQFYPDFIKIISSILKIDEDKINLNSPLSEYNVDSISIIQLTALFNDTYHLTATPASLFEYFTLAEFFNDWLEKYYEALMAYYSNNFSGLPRPSCARNDGAKEAEERSINLTTSPLKSNTDFCVGETPLRDVAATDGVSVEPRMGVPAKESPRHKNQPIAIIGMQGIFPQSKDINAFWEHLQAGHNLITEIPKERWNPQTDTEIKWGGFVDDIMYFDADFFNISPREAELTDPQQRIFLQVVWKAIEDAGYTPSDLAKTSTGIFVGVFGNDYAEILQQNGIVDAYITTGTTHSILANRISYLLNLHGPSVTIDTACSSSLVAIHQAVLAIQNGDCNVAIAGGVNALLSPTPYRIADKAGMLSKDGKCKTFDKAADGYVRGEGAAAIVLKSLNTAQADGDHIYGIIKGTAINHGGHVSSLTVPNPQAQAEVIVMACRRANITPDSIRCIETHGTGTSLGDPIEINGLKKAFAILAEEQDKKILANHYCSLGAVKTHIGHLESAAGIAGVIKVLLMMQHKEIPANLHFNELNPYIDLQESPFYIANKKEPFTHLIDKENQKIPLRAGISSFGFGGTNAHIIVEEFPYETRQRMALPAYPFAKEYYGITFHSTAYRDLSAASTRQSGYHEQYSEQIAAAAESHRQVDEQLFPNNPPTLHEIVSQNFKQIISTLLKKPITTINAKASLNELGLDSITLKELAIELEDHYDISLNPSLFFTYQTIEAISRYLIKTYPKKMTIEGENNFTGLPRTSCARNDGAKEEAEEHSKNPTISPLKSNTDFCVGETPLRDVAATDGVSVEHRKCVPAKESPRHKNQPIAIIGMQGIFPQSKDINAFWEHLQAGHDLITEIPKERWDWRNYYGDSKQDATKANSKWGGFINDIDKFDAAFFNISAREANLMDPRQRLFMEIAWKTIEDAGYDPLTFSQQETGVFIGIEANEYESIIAEQRITHGYATIGNADAILANRISYFLDLHGPSEVIHTACSSSLVAINRAVVALRNKECLTAIAGGASLILDPHKFVSISQLGILSPDGRCKTFDKTANGYVRGEGVAAILLKPLEQAQKDGDHIYGVIKGIATRHGGKAQSLTAPNAEAQSQLLVKTWQQADIDPETITYIEVHGTGTELGDPVEVEGLKLAFASALASQNKSASKTNYCGLGSVKTNIGHLEPASGIAGVIKVLLAMQHEKIPANLHLNELNPYIDLAETPFYLIEKLQPWNRLKDNNGNEIPRRAGVSSFGFGGSIVHILIEEAPFTALLLYEEEKRQRIASLSSYPFLKTRHWVETEIDLAFNEPVALKSDTPVHSESPSIDLQNFTLAYLQKIFAEKLKLSPQQIAINTTYEIYGVDSLLGLEITNRLEKDFGTLPKTLLYEKTQLRELADYLQKNFSETLKMLLEHSKNPTTFSPQSNTSFYAEGSCSRDVAAMDGASVEHRRCVPENKNPLHKNQPTRDVAATDGVSVEPRRGVPAKESPRHKNQHIPIAIVGLTGVYPLAQNIDELWHNLTQARDCITEIPSDRWNYQDYPIIVNGEKTWYKYGGFIPDIDKFDPLFFNISPREAAFMDPQERLFLQSAWSTLEDAGYTREKLQRTVNNQVGVFAGVTYNFYPLFIAEEWSKGNQLPLDIQMFSIANRVSYFLNVNGPSYVVDTACSSSLAAIHLACESIARGECTMAIAGGVNLSLHPYKYHFLGSYGFMSLQGQCASFAKGGTGYVPAEGVGSVLLKPLSLAIEHNDRIYAVIKGSSMNHGGKTSGYTVPNPNAQAELVKSALEKAGVDARTISYVEAHGTGTALGDPIEVRGLQEAFEAYTHDKQFCAIGSVKSNIGHLESAAGISQLTKVILQMRHKKFAPSLHAEELNPYIDFADTPFFVQREFSDWPSNENHPRRAGISSFGAGGTNVHLIVEEFQNDPQPVDEMHNEPILFLLSAANKEQLHQYAKNIHEFLIAHASYYSDENTLNEWLRNVCYTSQVGRESMATRLAILATHLNDLIEKLMRYIQTSEQAGSQLWINHDVQMHAITELSNEEIVTLMQENHYELLAELWIAGAKIPWEQTHREQLLKRVFLPTYPFAKRRCWVPSSSLPNESSHEAVVASAPAAFIAASPVLVAGVRSNPEEKMPVPSDINLKANQIEQQVIASLAKALALEITEISPTKLFHDYGLDSITGIHFVEELSIHFSNTVSPMDLYRYSTVERLVEHISKTYRPLPIQTVNSQTKEPPSHLNQSIAIIGLSCRFPQALNKQAYWQLLCEGKDAISSIPEQRWELLKDTHEAALRDKNCPYWGSYLSDIDMFDPYFFGISPREAILMDPEQRWLLEVAYEAIEDAGLSKEALAGSNTGVFAGLDASQFSHLQKLDGEVDALYLATGNATSIAANRISYVFDLQGPSMVLDTACSASLVATHLACLNLKNQLCDLAIVGGANINFLPVINLLLSKAKMLSPDGRCKTFDANANGYAPGEGIGVMILKPLDKAIQDKNRIYAVIEGSGVNQDGTTNGLTAPNGLQQEKLLKSVYAAAHIDPVNLSYVECHGTGTFLGDPIEVQALGEVISQNRSSENPCWIGSVKTNIGHLEPAAGIASMIKVALALEQKKIPPHINFSTPNPHIAFDRYHFRIPTQLEEWPKYGAWRMAGVSGFGFGGTNAHIIMREALETESTPFQQNVSPHIWQHKRYWPVLAKPFEPVGTVSNHYPLNGKQIISPLSALQFAFEFNTKTMPEIRDSYHIIHVGYYLEMLAFAVQQLHQDVNFTVENIVFLTPLMVPEDTVIKVQLVLQKSENGTMQFSFHSHASEVSWTEHAKGALLLTTAFKPIDSISAIKQRCTLEKDAEQFYHRISNLGLPTGESVRWTKTCRLGENEILCEFQAPAVSNPGENFVLKIHPGVIDASIHPLFLLLPEQANKPFIASRIEKIKFKAPPLIKGADARCLRGGGIFYLWASLKKSESTDEKIIGDWYLINQDNHIVAQCENISLTQIDSKIDIQKIIHSQEPQRIDFSGLSQEASKQKAIQYLTEQIAIIFSMPEEDVNIDQSLQKMGMDSLMALVLMRVIETGFGFTYSVQNILKGPSINEIADTLLQDRKDILPTPSKTPWIAYRHPQPSAKTRLFCFPYGGGGASIYRDWQAALPDDIEVCPIQLPGREGRMDEQPIFDINVLVDELVENLQSEFDLPYAFFGHSFGSLVAFALARRLRKKGLPLPKHLFASAYPDPGIPTKSLDNLLQQLNTLGLGLLDLDSASLAKLTDEKLMQLAAIFNENGVFDYGNSLIDANIVRLLLPIFVGDMRIVKSYSYHEEPPFNFPITVFLGTQDTWISYADQMGWAAHTQKQCDIHEFNSGHLFIRDNQWRKEVLNVIARHSYTAIV